MSLYQKGDLLRVIGGQKEGRLCLMQEMVTPQVGNVAQALVFYWDTTTHHLLPQLTTVEMTLLVRDITLDAHYRHPSVTRPVVGVVPGHDSLVDAPTRGGDVASIEVQAAVIVQALSFEVRGLLDKVLAIEHSLLTTMERVGDVEDQLESLVGEGGDRDADNDEAEWN